MEGRTREGEGREMGNGEGMVNRRERGDSALLVGGIDAPACHAVLGQINVMTMMMKKYINGVAQCSPYVMLPKQ